VLGVVARALALFKKLIDTWPVTTWIGDC